MGPHASLRAALFTLALSGCANAENLSPVSNLLEGELLVLKQNGGWCWYQDARAIVDRDRLLVGSVAGWTEHDSAAGDLDLTTYDLVTKQIAGFKLYPEFERDDHDAPSLLALPDGRYLAMFTKHANDPFMRWRLSSRPGDTTAWEPEQTIRINGAGGVTYSNTFVLSAESNRVYNFYRARGHNPWVMTADADVPSFQLSGRLLSWDKTEETGADPVKLTGHEGRTGPYLRYASKGVDTIHFVTTEDHPVAYDNSLYHGFVRGGAVYDSLGNVVDAQLFDETAASPVELTTVFAGDADHVAWPVDLELDPGGQPVVLLSVQHDAAHRSIEHEGGSDHRFHYGRFDGSTWHVHEIAHAGARLYKGQEDYTGLGAIDPNDMSTVYISTDADPVTGAPLVSFTDGKRHHEIFRGRTADGGATFTWTPLTRDSTTDNLRPIIPKWEGHMALLWLRGKYINMLHYRQDVVGVIDP